MEISRGPTVCLVLCVHPDVSAWSKTPLRLLKAGNQDPRQLVYKAGGPHYPVIKSQGSVGPSPSRTVLSLDLAVGARRSRVRFQDIGEFCSHEDALRGRQQTRVPVSFPHGLSDWGSR